MRKRAFAAILLLAPALSGCASFPDAFAPPNDTGKTRSVAAAPPAAPSSPSTPWLGQPTPASSASLGTPKPITDEAVLIYQPTAADSGAPIDMLKRPTPTDH